MNERIRELEKQSYTEARHELGGTYMAFDKEKFAELIVQECMWKIMLRKEEAIDNDWRVDEAMSTAISDISEHFGVKE
jgi:hypothetical protein